MFERKTLVALAEYWRLELELAHMRGKDAHIVRGMYVRHKEMLRDYNPAFKESVFDKASGYDKLFPNDTK